LPAGQRGGKVGRRARHAVPPPRRAGATTSGMAWQPPILYCQQLLGVDRVLYAMDYPYQFVPEEVKVTDELPISDADKKKLYQTNAEKVFDLLS
jgi:predicted TIM-barrel fold metal-dependent hydrolase